MKIGKVFLNPHFPILGLPEFILSCFNCYFKLLGWHHYFNFIIIYMNF